MAEFTREYGVYVGRVTKKGWLREDQISGATKEIFIGWPATR